MARKNGIERQLQAALDDATKQGLSVSEQRLIQTRITTLAALVQRQHDATVESLTNELSRVTEDNRRMAALLVQPTQPSRLREIQELLARYKSQSEEVA